MLKVVILAGGHSHRFWPVARENFPKHFITSDNRGVSFVEATVERAKKLTSVDDIYVVGNSIYEETFKQRLANISYISEPKPCQTAAALGLAALHIVREDSDAVMVALPADHAVWNEEDFRKTIIDASKIAMSYEVLVAVGIAPTFPHTDYGYIRRGEQIGEGCCDCRAYVVSRFYEKPNLKRARVYFASDEFYWNSGMFVWRPNVLLDAIKEFMPNLYAGLMEINKVIGTPQESQVVKEVYQNLEVQSIDFGVMEHAKNCVVVEAAPFGWDDVGAWDAWAEHLPSDDDGNVGYGDVLFIDSVGCIVHSEKQFSAVVGTDDMVVINTPDALLVCPRDKLSDIKKVVSELNKNGRSELL